MFNEQKLAGRRGSDAPQRSTTLECRAHLDKQIKTNANKTDATRICHLHMHNLS